MQFLLFNNSQTYSYLLSWSVYYLLSWTHLRVCVATALLANLMGIENICETIP